MTESKRPIPTGLFTKPGDQIVARDNETPEVISTDGASDGDVWTFNEITGLPEWAPGGSGGGVASVTAADATITIGGTVDNPTVAVTAGTYDDAGAAATAQANAE